MLPEKTWKTESVLRLMLGIFSTICVGALAAGALAHFETGLSDKTVKLLGLVCVTISFHGGALIWIRIFLRSENISWGEAFGFQSSRRGRSIRLAILAAVLVLPVAWGLQQLSVWLMTASNFEPEAQEVVRELQRTDASPFQNIYLGVVAMVAAPIVEEIVFRGILYPTIKQAGFPKVALWGTAILFALTHQNIPAFLPLVFLAIILTRLYEETGNLLAPIIAHSVFNMANFVMLLLALKFTES